MDDKFSVVCKFNHALQQSWSLYLKAKEQYDKSQAELLHTIATELFDVDGSLKDKEHYMEMLKEYKKMAEELRDEIINENNDMEEIKNQALILQKENAALKEEVKSLKTKLENRGKDDINKLKEDSSQTSRILSKLSPIEDYQGQKSHTAALLVDAQTNTEPSLISEISRPNTSSLRASSTEVNSTKFTGKVKSRQSENETKPFLLNFAEHSDEKSEIVDYIKKVTIPSTNVLEKNEKCESRRELRSTNKTPTIDFTAYSKFKSPSSAVTSWSKRSPGIRIHRHNLTNISFKKIGLK